MKFHVNFWCLKDKKLTQQEKNLVLRKKPEIWSWRKIYSIDLLFLVVLHDAPMLFWNDSVKNTCFGKTCFSR